LKGLGLLKEDPSMPDTTVIGSSLPLRLWYIMGESVLYFRKKNLLIKFDGFYWYWSSKERDWILHENFSRENYSIGDITYVSEQEAKKFIKNYPVPKKSWFGWGQCLMIVRHFWKSGLFVYFRDFFWNASVYSIVLAVACNCISGQLDHFHHGIHFIAGPFRIQNSQEFIPGVFALTERGLP
jgi:hypothetical protein